MGLPVKVDGENYAGLAVKTECPLEGPLERLKRSELVFELQRLMIQSVGIGTQQDRLKKFLFYGKETPLDAQASGRIDESVFERLQAPNVVRLLHSAIGLQTEVAELQEQLYRHVFLGEELDLVNVSEELGDHAWYIGIGAHVLHKSLNDLLQQNFNKLSCRYPAKFCEEDALERDLAKERAVLETAR